MNKRGATGRRKAMVDHGGPAWLAPMPVRTRMTPAPTVVRADTEVRAAAEMMRTHKIRHLPVVDHGGRLVGIVTDRDLRQVVFDPAIHERLGPPTHALADLPVREVMTWGVVSVHPATDLRDAACLMHDRKIGAVPVVEHGRVIGILSENDVLAALVDILRERLVGVRPLAGQPRVGQPYDYGFAWDESPPIS